MTGFTAIAGDGQITLNWTNPSDIDFAGVDIRRSTIGFPTLGGTFVAEVTGTPGGAGNYTDITVTNGTTYFYSAFAFDEAANFAVGAENAQATATPTLAADNTAPTVIGTSPADGATDVAFDTELSITFSEAMDTATTQGAFSVTNRVAGTFAWSVGNTVLTFTPDSNLAASTGYMVIVGMVAEDAAGNNLVATLTFTFTTGTAPDNIAPGNVTGFTATAGKNEITLNWTNPSEGDFVGMRIMRLQGATAPTTVSEGTQLAEVTGSPSASGNYTDSSLTNGTEYSYTAFAYDNANQPNYASGVQASATPNPPITAVQVVRGSSTCALLSSGQVKC